MDHERLSRTADSPHVKKKLIFSFNSQWGFLQNVLEKETDDDELLRVELERPLNQGNDLIKGWVLLPNPLEVTYARVWLVGRSDRVKGRS